jgi:hypothetical protein
MISNTLRHALALPMLSLALACQGATQSDTTDTDALGHSEAALDGCAAPALGEGSLCQLADGNVKFQVTLPSGQQFVEVFARQNGSQNLASNIVANASVHGDGSTTYALVRGGYADGDSIEYRFYSYLAGGAARFTPGPAQDVWLSGSYGEPSVLELPVTKDASLIYSSLGTGPSATRNFGAASTVDVAGYHHDSRGLFGYSLQGLDSTVTVTKAELVMPAMWAPGGNLGKFSLAVVDDSASWQELTVTWMTTPAATYAGEYTVDVSRENRLDVTALVHAALADGDSEISFLLEDIQNNLFIDAKEKAGGAPTYLAIEYAL